MPWLNYPVNRVCFNLPRKNRKREGLCQPPWLSLIWFFWFSKEFMDEPVQFWLVKLEIYNSVAIFNCENFPHAGLGLQKLLCQKPKLLISQSEMAINFKSINYLEMLSWLSCVCQKNIPTVCFAVSSNTWLSHSSSSFFQEDRRRLWSHGLGEWSCVQEHDSKFLVNCTNYPKWCGGNYDKRKLRKHPKILQKFHFDD